MEQGCSTGLGDAGPASPKPAGLEKQQGWIGPPGYLFGGRNWAGAQVLAGTHPSIGRGTPGCHWMGFHHNQHFFLQQEPKERGAEGAEVSLNPDCCFTGSESIQLNWTHNLRVILRQELDSLAEPQLTLSRVAGGGKGLSFCHRYLKSYQRIRE